jgi:hypothetical protein
MLADPVDLLRCDIDPQLRAVEFTVAWTYTTRDRSIAVLGANRVGHHEEHWESS